MRGHIRKRVGSRGTSWQVIVTVPGDPLTGRPRQVSATARTKREAETILNRLVAEAEAGQHSGPDAMVAELLE